MAARSEHKDLLPDRDVAVRLAGGETITVRVRAYRAAEYFEVRPLARPVLDALAALDLDASEDTEYLLDAAWAVLAEHADTMRALVLLAVDRPLDLGEVTAESFQGLFYAVLDANHPFFWRCSRSAGRCSPWWWGCCANRLRARLYRARPRRLRPVGISGRANPDVAANRNPLPRAAGPAPPGVGRPHARSHRRHGRRERSASDRRPARSLGVLQPAGKRAGQECRRAGGHEQAKKRGLGHTHRAGHCQHHPRKLQKLVALAGGLDGLNLARLAAHRVAALHAVAGGGRNPVVAFRAIDEGHGNAC
ncbi:MAG: hypothetical protein L0H19_06425 [Salinisphaera sp.]|nr:hypothetical protein [Salinisphaera sp.]